MEKVRDFIRSWGPAFFMMALIFWISSQPSTSLPNLQLFDRLVKKGGHMLGYGLLALTYWHGFGYRYNMRKAAWYLAIIYALTDEVHQSFVPGRNPSLVDVLIFDNLGAILSLVLYNHFREK